MIEVVDTVAGLMKLEREWDALALEFQNPLLTHEWFAACAAAVSSPDELMIILVRDGEALVAAAPMVKVHRRGVRRLEMLGSSTLQEPSGFLFRDEESLNELLRALTAQRLPIRLGRIAADSPEIRLARGLSAPLRGVTVRRQSASPWLLIDRPWEDFEAGISSSRRSSLRRARRRLDQMGEVQIQVESPTEETVESYLREFVNVEATGWKGRLGTAIQSDPRSARFFTSYVHAAARTGALRFFFLRVDGQAVAGILAVEHARRLWVLKVGFDETWAHCSPGILLMHEAIRWAFSKGLSDFEFLGTDEPWIHMWTSARRAYVLHDYYPFSIDGFAWFAIDLVNASINRVHCLTSRPGGYDLFKPLARLKKRSIDRIGHRYVAGPELADAISVCRRIAEHNILLTVAHWRGDSELPGQVLKNCKAAIDSIAAERFDGQLSVKVSDLRYDPHLVRELACYASRRRVPLQFDAVDAQTQDKTMELIEDAHAIWELVGCTLPSRWERSIEDAERAIRSGVSVRVVKGQWSDPKGNGIDCRRNFRVLIEALAGRCAHVFVGTHDRQLGREALMILHASDTRCELEQMLGLPSIAKSAAEPLGIPVRLYVPFGAPYLPYNIRYVSHRPAMIAWALNGLLTGGDWNQGLL